MNMPNDFTPQQQDQIKQIATDLLKKSFSSKRVGDTPTDTLQLSNKRYVDGQRSSVFSSIQSGLTINGNLNVTGSASITGEIRSTTITSGSDLVVGGDASIVGALKVGGNTSVVGILYVDNIINGGSIQKQGLNIPQVYSGLMNSSGTAGSPFPSGWTPSILGTGLYKITHGFGSTLYSVVATAYTFVAAINAINTNDFQINTFSSAGSAQNDKFNFIVIKP